MPLRQQQYPWLKGATGGFRMVRAGKAQVGLQLPVSLKWDCRCLCPSSGTDGARVPQVGLKVPVSLKWDCRCSCPSARSVSTYQPPLLPQVLHVATGHPLLSALASAHEVIGLEGLRLELSLLSGSIHTPSLPCLIVLLSC